MIDVFLQPGEFFVGGAQYRLRTLLGSCVSITLWHPLLRIGAMSHFLLSSRGSGTTHVLDGRYGEEAFSLMCRALQKSGVPVQACQAKIFGGGNMFPDRLPGLNIGQKNGQAARALLTACGIKIVSESLYGAGHRQIIFEVRNGDVWVRQVKPADTAPPAIRKYA